MLHTDRVSMICRAKQIIPPLLSTFHKGQLGRVAVVGGCEDYSGSPFFSAMASALTGADLSHVICEPQAAQVIKSYSPNLMVHPYMRQSNNQSPSTSSVDDVLNKMSSLMDRLNVLVVGPGLGRDPLMQQSARGIILEAKRRYMPIVIDADALLLITEDPGIIMGYEYAVLTPNLVEFARICKACGIDPKIGSGEHDVHNACDMLAAFLAGVTIIRKGSKDCISNGMIRVLCDIPGGLKRSGGQGDTLTGSLATFLAWQNAYKDKLWDHDGKLTQKELMIVSAYAASALTRTCSRLAFEKKGRALQATDLSNEVQSAFVELFGED